MEKVISSDNGSDMLALQAFMVFAEMPSIPEDFFRLDLSMRVSILSEVEHSQILIGLKQHLGVFRYPRGRGHFQCPRRHLHRNPSLYQRQPIDSRQFFCFPKE